MKSQLFKARPPDSIFSEPNIITLLRLTASLTFFALAIIKGNAMYNYIGFVIHWIGDWIDGFYARTLKQETILGAEIDIIADRLELICFYVIFLHFRPYLYLPVMLYLVDYAFIDFYLSYQFVKFDIISPNYFYKVNKRVFLLNYAPVSKFCNSSVVTLTLIFLPSFYPFVIVFACGLIAVKSYSVYLILQERAKMKVSRISQ
jgi:CDP-diacylglycerol--glycerol-3-phosphate 3-phosphatidyltransferase